MWLELGEEKAGEGAGIKIYKMKAALGKDWFSCYSASPTVLEPEGICWN